jgi:uncharacterized protein (DUF885 family)
MSRVPRFTALALAASLWAAVPAPAIAQSAAAPASAAAAAQALRTLFADEWERGLREHPENASYHGDTRYNDRWTDNSLAAIAAREAADRAALVRLQAIPRAALSPAEQIDRDTFEWLQQRTVERQRFREHLQPINHQGGITTADGIAEVMPFATPADYRQYLSRLTALPQVVDQTLVLMREGVKAGIVPPRVLMQRVPAQIAAQIVDDPQRSPFYKPFTRFPMNFPAAERSALQAQAQATLLEQVVPAYRRLQTAFLNDYLPHTRSSIAATDRPDGAAYYDFLARDYTTTEMGADAIHELGLKEVARIRAAMERVKLEAGYSGTLEAFFTFLRSDPRFFLKTSAELLTAYRAVAKRIDPELVKVFRTIPRLPYGVKGIPDSIAPDTTTAYYQPAAADGSRAGIYYVNLYKPEVRPTWEMVPLSLHEAVPGHHFQFARALELPDAPQFRRTAYFVAYSEGWGLYAEQLGHEMGLYDDPYDRFGQLTYEMWRAVRLVVDTGMHTKGWTRERSIAYFQANAAKTEQDIVNEIDRYINTPAQALAYKVGQLQISALRTRAQLALGERFDLRDFNDAVLATGSVPLAALQGRIEAWIAEQQGRPPG